MNSTNEGPGSMSQNWQTNGSSIPWNEVISRHESVLISHREMLDSLREHIAPDGEASRALSTMLNKTTQMVNQFKVLQKHMLNKPNEYSDSTSTSRSRDTESTKRKKRSRLEKEQDTMNPHAGPQFQATSEAPASKRMRNPETPPNLPDEPEHFYEPEDISAEVQRRLRIKEERRRKKGYAQSEKRKRESLLSNESFSSSTGYKPHKKRARVGNDVTRDGSLVADQESDWRSKRQRQ